MYTVQNKVLPGAYINFVSAARASATLGDRGTAAFPLSLDWGPENEVVTIENSEFQKGSLALTGYAYTADELRPLREIFANAKTLHLFRLNSGGAKAACKYAEAKYPGQDRQRTEDRDSAERELHGIDERGLRCFDLYRHDPCGHTEGS